MEPLVSILIPAYNAEAWIADSIKSALGQTWRRKEVIVVDDGSTDRTRAIARRFASREVTIVAQESRLAVPRLRWKYVWIKSIFGWNLGKRAETGFPQLRRYLVGAWDKAMYKLERVLRGNRAVNNSLSRASRRTIEYKQTD
jgi:glycosyltransferase involved in cell wall biosynthesis